MQPAGERVGAVTRRRKTRGELESLERHQQRGQGDSDTSSGGQQAGSGLQEALAPLVEEQRIMSERIGKLSHSIGITQ